MSQTMSWMVMCAILFNLNVVSSSDFCTGNAKDLHLIGFFPYTGAWQGGESLQAAVEIAINQVNQMNALPGYCLHMLSYGDTKCHPGLGIKALFEQLYNPPTKLAIIGAGCSIVSEATARASHLWNLVQVSYASVSPTLSDKSKFPLFARLSPPEQFMNPARMQLFRHFGWTKIAIICQSYLMFSTAAEDLRTTWVKEGNSIIRSEIFYDNPRQQIRNLKDYDSRIIVGYFYQDKADLVMCEAFKAGLFGPKIVWILIGWYDEGWWRKGNTTTDCTQEQLAEAVEGYFSAGIVYLNPKPQPSVSGLLPSQFMEVYRKAVNNRTLSGDSMAPQGYDTVWALTKALNNTREILEERGGGKRLEDFTYDDVEMGRLIYSSLLNASLMGVGGPLSFDANGDPIGMVKFDRLQGGELQTVGYYYPMKKGDASLEWSETPIIWKEGAPARDAILDVTEYVSLSVGVYATMCVLASLGILLAIVFLIFNFVLRHVRMIKMSSPRMNNVILTGCIFAYCSIFIKGAGAGHGAIGCEIRTTLLVLGISLVFGALFAKTWRVHAIFANVRLKRRILSDACLIGLVCVLLLVNLSVLIVWWTVDLRTVEVRNVNSVERSGARDDVKVTFKERHCTSTHELKFLGTLYAIHALLLLAGVFIAFETRKVHFPELNDSKYIGMSIYNVALLSIPAMVLGVALNPAVDLKYAIESTLVLLGNTVTQCLIFVPKVYCIACESYCPNLANVTSEAAEKMLSYREHRVQGVEMTVITRGDASTVAKGQVAVCTTCNQLPPNSTH